jgi:hypothetical protein
VPVIGTLGVVRRAKKKAAMVGGSALLDATLVATGIANRLNPEFFHPVAIWLCGIVTLASAPFQIGVLPRRARRRAARGAARPRLAAPRAASVERYPCP